MYYCLLVRYIYIYQYFYFNHRIKIVGFIVIGILESPCSTALDLVSLNIKYSFYELLMHIENLSL